MRIVGEIIFADPDPTVLILFLILCKMDIEIAKMIVNETTYTQLKGILLHKISLKLCNFSYVRND